MPCCWVYWQGWRQLCCPYSAVELVPRLLMHGTGHHWKLPWSTACCGGLVCMLRCAVLCWYTGLRAIMDCLTVMQCLMH